MFNRFISELRLKRIRHEWRKLNSHNSTNNMNGFSFDHVTVGKYTYGELTVLDFDDRSHLRIGNFCSIASDVVFALSSEHPIHRLSTFPMRAKCLGENVREAGSKGNIEIGDDVWIGQGAIILSGVTIGQGAIIAAGAVVNRDVKPYEIVGGVPSKHISYRFESDIINELTNFDFSKLTKEMIEEHIDVFYLDNIDIEKLDWFPKKDNR